MGRCLLIIIILYNIKQAKQMIHQTSQHFIGLVLFRWFWHWGNISCSKRCFGNSHITSACNNHVAMCLATWILKWFLCRHAHHMISVEMKLMWVKLYHADGWQEIRNLQLVASVARWPPSIILGECCFHPVTSQEMLPPITLTLAGLPVSWVANTVTHCKQVTIKVLGN